MIGSIGGPEFLLILGLALLLFGPRKLPQIGRTLGRALSEFRGATQEFRSTLEREVEMESLKETRDSLQSAGREVRDAVSEASGLGVPRKTGPVPAPGSGPTAGPGSAPSGTHSDDGPPAEPRAPSSPSSSDDPGSSRT